MTDIHVDEARPGHPTRRKLLEAACALLDDTPAEQITISAVLGASGVSHGSLYHHFDDFPDLVEQAIVLRFTRHVEASVRDAQALFRDSVDEADFRRRVEALTVATHRPERAPQRGERLQGYAAAAQHPRMRARLAQAQQELTVALRDIVADAQERGWVRADADPDVLAVLIQALPLGRVVDDFAAVQVDPTAWTRTVMRAISAVAFD